MKGINKDAQHWQVVETGVCPHWDNFLASHAIVQTSGFNESKGPAAEMPMRTRVKICCIASIDEAREAVRAGADALGLVGSMPSGPGIIDDPAIAGISAQTPPAVATFLLTSEQTADGIHEHVLRAGTSTVQIVSHIPEHEAARLAQLLPATRRVQVIHVENAGVVDLIPVYAPYVHGFLLDSGTPSAAVPQFGGTGQAHDWGISKAFVAASPLPVFLAGGLNPDNVKEAVRTVRPFGLDLCTGVRTDDALDGQKLKSFMASVAAVDAEMARQY